MDYILEPLISYLAAGNAGASTVSNRAERKVYLIVAIFQTACLFAAAFAMRRKDWFKTESGDNQDATPPQDIPVSPGSRRRAGLRRIGFYLLVTALGVALGMFSRISNVLPVISGSAELLEPEGGFWTLSGWGLSLMVGVLSPIAQELFIAASSIGMRVRPAESVLALSLALWSSAASTWIGSSTPPCSWSHRFRSAI